MNQINKNRLIGGSVIAFAALLFAPAILTPKENDLSNPTLAVSIDQTTNPVAATTSSSTTTKNIPIPPPPALKLESAPATNSTKPVAQQPTTATTKTATPQPTPVAMEKKTTVAKAATIKPVTTAKSSWLRVGSYASAKNADNQLKKLNKSKYSVKIEQITINGKAYHRVLVGPYSDEKALQTAKKALIASGYEANIQR